MPLHTYRILLDGLMIIVSTLVTYYQDIIHNMVNELAILSEDQQNELHGVARKPVESGKGILAADESIDTIGERFSMIGMENNANRRNCLHLLSTTPNISQYISGIILHKETFSQSNDVDKRFVDIIAEAVMLPGIKLDKGLEQFGGSSEYITNGKSCDFKKGGCQFAKWRYVYVTSKVTPSRKVLKENTKISAQYAISIGAGTNNRTRGSIILKVFCDFYESELFANSNANS
uniref:fructose-bisphosphate aldolase n=1 Tax=Elaeophora elaphi TaxID=1147741 RepID=A0A0R3RSJ4_9BILA